MTEVILMKLSTTLPYFCKQKEWSLSQLARESKVPIQTLHNWVIGSGRKHISIEQLKKVSEALEVPLHELCFGTKDPFENFSEEVLRELFSGDIRVTLHKIERSK
ncbi:MAG: helix-turn-helix domain-containing protein [Bdellovibrionales bacterium]